jgi:YesN/AraC family two-component response regulator
MESSRCTTMVKNELHKLGLLYKTVELGEVELKGNVSGEKLRLFDIALKNSGLELMNDKKKVLIEKIKAAISQLIYISDDSPKPIFSNYISEKVNHDYAYLSNLFSGTEGVTIETYIISQKIERVKELLVYDGFSLSDIAYKLQYSSVAHLSNQFKKVTGLTLSHFRQLRDTRFRK